MKKILITGANSYIGTSFEKYMAQWADDYQVDTVDMVDGSWREMSFSGYDSVFHVAGIAHVKETPGNRELYYRVNRDLAVETAQKAKNDGVRQFIFLTYMSVYGLDVGVITPETKPAPNTNYGKSKLEAEQAMAALADESFRVAVLRPPMVYGKNCKGNFQTMCKLLRLSPVFPAISNQRSMIFVENLCSFVKLAVDRQCHGLFFPQNREYVNTTDMAKAIVRVMGRKVWFSAFAGWAVRCMEPVLGVARKAFGTLIYQDCECFDYCYCVRDMEQSVRESI